MELHFDRVLKNYLDLKREQKNGESAHCLLKEFFGDDVAPTIVLEMVNEAYLIAANDEDTDVGGMVFVEDEDCLIERFGLQLSDVDALDQYCKSYFEFAYVVKIGDNPLICCCMDFARLVKKFENGCYYKAYPLLLRRALIQFYKTYDIEPCEMRTLHRPLLSLISYRTLKSEDKELVADANMLIDVLEYLIVNKYFKSRNQQRVSNAA